MLCLGRPLGGGEGAPFCVSPGHLTPPRDAKGLQPGFSSVSVCPLFLLHSVTAMPGTSSWGPSWIPMELSSKMVARSVLKIPDILCTSCAPCFRSGFKHDWQAERQILLGWGTGLQGREKIIGSLTQVTCPSLFSLRGKENVCRSCPRQRMNKRCFCICPSPLPRFLPQQSLW